MGTCRTPPSLFFAFGHFSKSAVNSSVSSLTTQWPIHRLGVKNSSERQHEMKEQKGVDLVERTRLTILTMNSFQHVFFNPSVSVHSHLSPWHLHEYHSYSRIDKSKNEEERRQSVSERQVSILSFSLCRVLIGVAVCDILTMASYFIYILRFVIIRKMREEYAFRWKCSFLLCGCEWRSSKFSLEMNP